MTCGANPCPHELAPKLWIFSKAVLLLRQQELARDKKWEN